MIKPKELGSNGRTRRIRVLLAEDHAIVREGLAGILTCEPDISIVGEAEDGRAAVEMAHRLEPDVVVMDVNMPFINGIEATRRIRARLPAVRIIGLSAHDREEVARALIEAGGTAYLCKSGPPEDLIGIIRTSAQPLQAE